MSYSLQGISASKGFAIAPLHIFRRGLPEFEQRKLRKARLPAEQRRFERALEIAALHLEGVRQLIPADTPGDITAFIDTHMLMLRDTALVEGVIRLMHEQRCNVEWAIKQQRDTLLQVFDAMDDDYLRTRRDDVDHVFKLILQSLLSEARGVAARSATANDAAAAQTREPRVVFADDLTPADTITMRDQQVAAFVTELGGPNSHTAIVARSLRIPAIVGLAGAGQRLREGDRVVVDGREGLLIVDPDAEQLERYARRSVEVERLRKQRRRLRSSPARTLDGEDVCLEANIDLPPDINNVRYEGATGVGLYRTEYLFMNRDELPDEDEQYVAYRNVLRRLKGAPVTIRTLDLGADKTAIGAVRDGVAPTGALGLRAVRYCLREPHVFRTQLRAILRASAHGHVRLLVPMVCSVSELAQVRELFARCREELATEGVATAADIPLGVMVEVPAVAVCADEFARVTDFLSIGTNDLIQYTLAIDRGDDEVSYLYDPIHPAVLRLVRTVLSAGKRARKPVAMCGEMAGEATYTRLLLGLGLREFSVHPSALLEVKQAINSSDSGECSRIVQRLLRATTAGTRERLHAQLNEGLLVE